MFVISKSYRIQIEGEPESLLLPYDERPQLQRGDRILLARSDIDPNLRVNNTLITGTGFDFATTIIYLEERNPEAEQAITTRLVNYRGWPVAATYLVDNDTPPASRVGYLATSTFTTSLGTRQGVGWTIALNAAPTLDGEAVPLVDDVGAAAIHPYELYVITNPGEMDSDDVTQLALPAIPPGDTPLRTVSSARMLDAQFELQERVVTDIQIIDSNTIIRANEQLSGLLTTQGPVVLAPGAVTLIEGFFYTLQTLVQTSPNHSQVIFRRTITTFTSDFSTRLVIDGS